MLVLFGTTVTLTGSGFVAGMQVSFGGAPATAVSVTSDGTLTAVAPAHSAATVDISVTTPGGATTLGLSFAYLSVPTLNAVGPAEGPTAGGTTVTLTGSHLTGTKTVTFGGAPATAVTVLDDATVTATTPAHLDGPPVDVVLDTPGGTATLTEAFTFVPRLLAATKSQA